MALRRIADRLMAVVMVVDDGGSPGRSRSEFGCLPPGDLRMALAALCGDDQVRRRWAKTLQSRFSKDGPLDGYAIGNLLIVGLWQQLDDPVAGLDMAGELLKTQGGVFPMSSIPLQIKADVLGLNPLAPGEPYILAGQATVVGTRITVQSVRLVPENLLAHPEAVAAVRQTGAIVLGPGSQFTLVILHLMVPELHDTILSTSARHILVVNITVAGEIDGFIASRYVELLVEHAPTLHPDFVLVDISFVGSDCCLTQFAASLGVELAVADTRCHDGSARHDPKRLADAYQELLAS